MITFPLSNKKSNNTYSPTSCEIALEFCNVFFKYNENPVFEDLSFKIYKNKINILRGKNGCGKSTIIKLIMKIHESYEGDIFINGKNIKNISYDNLHDNISLLTQDDCDLYITPQEIISEYKKRSNLNDNLLKKLLTSLNINEDILEKNSFSKMSGGERKNI